MSSSISLARFLATAQQQQHLDHDLAALISAVARTCVSISDAVNQGALAGVLGEAGTGNVQGEDQKKLDVIANQMLLDGLAWTGLLSGMASEEMEHASPIPADYPQGPYLLLFDPLDGSSNIDVNVSVGSIFSILRLPEGADPSQAAAFLQTGVQQVAAGYALYGPSTMLVISVGQGVHGFTLDRNTGLFYLTHPDMSIPADTKEFAINASRARFWEAPVKRYVDECLAGKTGPRGRDFNMRWIASMVAEVHRILTRGGLFMYPMDAENQAKGGKLRLMYEANPMSFLVEQAGGAASTGRQRIMDVAPTGLHQRISVILGSKHEVERVASYHAE